ncbi:hypothetical protein BDD12DRAFT_830483 [Trichophaea hybrida]|nr:hypothetical protein BDD12DRAFT_830483 [Trichophaea hybrida]
MKARSKVAPHILTTWPPSEIDLLLKGLYSHLIDLALTIGKMPSDTEINIKSSDPKDSDQGGPDTKHQELNDLKNGAREHITSNSCYFHIIKYSLHNKNWHDTLLISNTSSYPVYSRPKTKQYLLSRERQSKKSSHKDANKKSREQDVDGRLMYGSRIWTKRRLRNSKLTYW